MVGCQPVDAAGEISIHLFLGHSAAEMSSNSEAINISKIGTNWTHCHRIAVSVANIQRYIVPRYQTWVNFR